MLSASAPFRPKFYAGKFPQSLDPPALAFECKATWENGYKAPLVFIGLCQPTKGCREVYVFGARFELSRGMIEGLGTLDGYIIEYMVVEADERGLIFHRLAQGGGVDYAEPQVPSEYIDALDVAKQGYQKFCQFMPPKWYGRGVQWPTHNGEPMEFVAQFFLPENEITSRHLTWDKNVYLFQHTGPKGSTYKIMTQNVGEQTAEDHYVTE